LTSYPARSFSMRSGLLVGVARALVKRGSLRAEDIEDVIVGCVSEVKEQGANLARNAVLAAGALPGGKGDPARAPCRKLERHRGRCRSGVAAWASPP
jgi:acetyl-CoA acetyltransferase